MRLIFVRHAESIGNAEGRYQGHTEFDLSETGVAQAERLRDRFVDEDLAPTHAYSSPTIRTSETARIVMEPWPVETAVIDDLIEVDVGAVSGLTGEEFVAKFPAMGEWKSSAAQVAQIPGAERLAARRARAARVVRQLVSGHDDSDVVLAFSHGGILSHIVAELLGATRSWSLGAGNTAIFDFSVDLGRWSDEGLDTLYTTTLWQINRFSDTTHLDGAAL